MPLVDTWTSVASRGMPESFAHSKSSQQHHNGKYTCRNINVSRRHGLTCSEKLDDEDQQKQGTNSKHAVYNVRHVKLVVEHPVYLHMFSSTHLSIITRA